MGGTILGLNIGVLFCTPLFTRNEVPKMKGNRMKHLSINKCFNNSVWQGYTLQCPCGRQLAVRYMIDKEVRVFTFGKFSKYKQKILTRKDTQEITRKSDLLGHLGNEEWEEILCDIRQRKADT